MRKPNRACIALVISAIFAFSASAESAPSIESFAANGFPDNADLRGRLFAYVIGASRDVALKYGEKQLQSAAGPVTVRVENRSADFIVEFLNANAVDPGQAGRGSVFIQRGNGKGNYILQARILLEDDPSCYLTLYPSGSGTRGDVVMYGAVVKKGLYFSDMLYRRSSCPFPISSTPPAIPSIGAQSSNSDPRMPARITRANCARLSPRPPAPPIRRRPPPPAPRR